MPWFKVDDQLSMHPKVIKVGNAAMGLWVRAGSWSAAHLTDGLIPASVVAALGGTKAQAITLVKGGLWEVDPEGYRFHDWFQFQPSAQDTQLAKERESESGAKGNHIKWHVKRGIANPDCALCSGLES